MEIAEVLAVIESIVGDDQCEWWDMENAHRRFRGRSRLMQEKLSLIYRIAHSAQPTHSCHQVHDDWRALAESMKHEATQPEPNVSGETRAKGPGIAPAAPSPDISIGTWL